MTYSGSSCEDIYSNNPETGEKSGYYRISDNQWSSVIWLQLLLHLLLEILYPHVLVWVEDEKHCQY